MRPEFWNEKSVFLTGHTGFKGSWLSLWLSEMGAVVTGFALPATSRPNLFEVADVASAVHSLTGDIRDYDALLAAMRIAKPDIVIHMAAQSLVRYSYAEPVETYATNVMGTVHVLEAVRQLASVQATLIVTSDKCYENREQIWGYRENDRMGGHDPYSNSKGCAELVTQAYGRSFFEVNPACGALASARAGNVIGGGDWALDRLVPDIMRSLTKGEAPILRNPKSIRPWQHVLEPLSGYLTAIEYIAARKFPAPDSWNFAPAEDSHVTVGRVARSLCEAWGKGIMPVIQENPGSVHEANLLSLDATKARQELGWTPRWKLDETLARTAAWYRAHDERQNMRDFTRSQIRDYTTITQSPDSESLRHVAA